MTPGAAASPLFAADEIAARVDALAADVAKQLPRDVLVVGILVAAFVFTADLVRALGRHGAAPRVEFLRLASYGDRTAPAGPPRLIGPVPDGLAGQDLLLVDTVHDTGHTLATALDLVRARRPRSVRTCVLVDKPARRATAVAPDFAGFTADGFLIGYGLDGGQGERWLPHIAVLRT
jgi:hypoxanthine phosphoribosyltransferase